jgi:hypothetical protein
LYLVKAILSYPQLLISHQKSMEHEQPQNIDYISVQEPVQLVQVTEQKPQIPDEKVTYVEKTERIRAWSQFIKSVSPYLWATVIIIVIIPLLGRGFIANSYQKNIVISDNSPPLVAVIDKQQPDWSKVDQSITIAIKNAKITANNFASENLDTWVDELMTRVDNSFLEWYFNYFNQKKLEFSAPFMWISSAVTHWIDSDNPSPEQAVAEKMTEDFQLEFAKRVLRPKIAQLELERITRDTVNLYVSQLENNISSVQGSYKIPQGEWGRYLDDIAVTINDTEGVVSNLSLKALVGGSSYLLVKATIPIAAKIGSKVAVSFAGKFGAKIAAKTGGAVAANIGAGLLDPIIGAGIIIWDLWDYHHTVDVNRPILRAAILDYLSQVKKSLLDNNENGIMASVAQLEGGILKSVQSAN